ncbi:MAG TPA: MFS transporter [Streptosporangiaceae bacterium]|nr:MFS transporter [Streptosporangiaceae bacterium]
MTSKTTSNELGYPAAPRQRLSSGPAAPARPGLVLLVMCAGMFLVLLDVTVVNVAVPAITTGLRTGTAGVQWVVDGYTVALASLLLIGGTLGDRIGHRRAVLAGLVLFGAASAGCAVAPAVAALVAARAGQGVGAALLLPGSMAAIAHAYPARADQARAFGVWAGVSALALPAGPLLGGLLVTTAGWRAVFWINPPVVAACLAGVLAWVRAPGGHEARPDRVAEQGATTAPGRRLDVRGLVLVTVALAALVYAVISAGDGQAPLIVAAAGALAVLAAAGFVLAERRAPEPLLPLTVLSSPRFRVANTAALVMNLTSNGLLFVLTRYLQSVRGVSALTAGLMMLPLFVPLAVLSPLAGRLTARSGPRPALLAGAVLAAAGQLSMLAVTPASPYLQLLPALLGVGLGLGLFNAPVVATAIRAVPAGQSGLASGINNTARQAGTALGVAIFGAVAGSPAASGHFTAGLHGLGVAAALAWAGVIALLARRDLA